MKHNSYPPPSYTNPIIPNHSMTNPCQETVIITSTNYSSTLVRTTCPNCGTQVESTVNGFQGPAKWFSFIFIIFFIGFFLITFYAVFKSINNMPDHKF